MICTWWKIGTSREEKEAKFWSDKGSTRNIFSQDMYKDKEGIV